MKFSSRLPLIAAFAASFATCASADPKADISAAMKAQNDAPAFRAKISTLDNSTKAATTITMESVKPDQMHVKTEMGPGMVVEMYSDGKKTVMSQGGGAYMDAPPQVAEMLGKARQQATMDTALQAAKNIQVAGHETVNGNAATVYSYDADMMGMQSTNKIWISDKDHRPLKSESGVHGSVQMGTEPGPAVDMKVTTSFDYDPSIKIVMPTK